MKYSADDTVIKSLADIISRLNPVELVTPTNAEKEKQLWCKIAENGFYVNPRFSYNEALLKEASGYSQELIAGKNHLKSNLTPETPAEKVILDILLDRIDSAITCTEIAASILLGDDKTTSKLSVKIYGRPSNVQALDAYRIADRESDPNEIPSRFTEEEQKTLKAMKLDAIQIGSYFTQIVNKYGINDWIIEVGDQYTAIDVRDKNSTGKPLVGIPTKRTVDGLKLLELAGHEINCHLRGSVNCKALVERILGPDSPLVPLYGIISKNDNELFYEGVAKISDVTVNGSNALPLPFATIACEQARRGKNFAEIAGIIEEKRTNMGALPDKAVSSAWTTTYRIMRGSTDTTKGGYCFTKDYIYMCGYDIAKRVDPMWRNYASMSLDEIGALAEVTDISEPLCPDLDIVGWLKNELLSTKDA